MILTMAWRNLWRRKRRTLITSSTVAIGLWVAMSFAGIADYSYTKMINTSASMGYGHVSVEPADYINSPTFNKRIADAEGLRDEIMKTEGITHASIKIIGQGMFGTATKAVGGLMLGIDPSRERPTENLFLRSIVEGTPFNNADSREVVVGKKLAEKLNLKIGKKLVYTATDATGNIVSEMARVSAIFKTGEETVDGSTILLPINQLRRTLHYGPRDATLISIFIDDQRQAPRIRTMLQKKLNPAGIDIWTWRETQHELAGTIALDRTLHNLFQLFVWLLVAAGILDAILMSVLERKREMGVMMAIGMSPGALFRLVIIESFLTALLGLGIGILINTPWYWYMSTTGIDLSSMVPEGYGAGGVLVDPVIKIRIYKESVAITTVSFFSLTLLAGLYPAFKASRVPPVESMKTS